MSRQPYVRPMPKASWYLGSARYRRYMLREVTCLLVGFYCALMIWALAALAGGAERWDSFLTAQHNTGFAVFHALALVFYSVYMTFDWFKLAPKPMPIWLGEKKVPDGVITGAHYVVWALFTLLVLWLVGVM